jgi:hypothetical protein
VGRVTIAVVGSTCADEVGALTRRAFMRSTPERILFEEKPEADLGLLYAIVVMVLIDDIILTLLLIHLGAPQLLVIVVIGMNAALLALAFSFVRLRKVRLTDRRVVLRFGISGSSILLSNIRSVGVEDPPTWNKIGLVSGWRGTAVYCFKSSSPFVKLEYGTRKLRKVFFNVDRLPEFITKLKRIMEPR